VSSNKRVSVVAEAAGASPLLHHQDSVFNAAERTKAQGIQVALLPIVSARRWGKVEFRSKKKVAASADFRPNQIKKRDVHANHFADKNSVAEGVEPGEPLFGIDGVAPIPLPSGIFQTGANVLEGKGAERRSSSQSQLDIEAVRLMIQSELQYPRMARRRKIQGTVILRFQIASGGKVFGMEVIKGGHGLLEQAAFKAVQRAVPFKPGMRGWFRVPIKFKVN